MFIRKFALPLIILNSIGSQALAAQLEMTAETKTSYDTSVGIAELDDNSDVADLSSYLSLSPKISSKLSSPWTVKAMYFWSQKQYQEQSQYDLGIQRLHLSSEYEFESFGRFGDMPSTLGYSFDRVNADLSQQDYLKINIHSLYFSQLRHNSLFWRFDLTAKNKAFAELNGRNADNMSLGLLTFYFFNSHNSHFSFALRNENESAIDTVFSNQALSFSAALGHKFKILNRPGKLKLSYSLRQADYNSTPFIVENYQKKNNSPEDDITGGYLTEGQDSSAGNFSKEVYRNDKNHTLSLLSSINVFENIDVVAEIKKERLASNLDSVSYQSLNFTTGFEFHF